MRRAEERVFRNCITSASRVLPRDLYHVFRVLVPRVAVFLDVRFTPQHPNRTLRDSIPLPVSSSRVLELELHVQKEESACTASSWFLFRRWPTDYRSSLCLHTRFFRYKKEEAWSRRKSSSATRFKLNILSVSLMHDKRKNRALLQLYNTETSQKLLSPIFLISGVG